MKTMFALLCLALIPQDMPLDAQKVIAQADVKLDALRKSYEDACAKVKAQELKDLQRIHDAIEKGNPAGATAIKIKIDTLAADVTAVVKGSSSVEQWLQGKWIATLGGAGDVIEFKGDKIVGSGIGDRTKGKVVVDGSTVQLVWESGYVETMRVPRGFGDEATGTGRSGALVFKRLK
jgi:hypothetical protein